MKIIKLGFEKKRKLYGLVFFLPFIFGFCLFFAYPMAMSIRYALSAMSFRGVLDNLTFVGFSNFTKAFMVDVEFMPNFINTVITTFARTPLIVIFSMILAIILNKKIRLQGLFRTIFFLPFLLGTGFALNLLLGLGTNKGEVDFFRGVVLTPDFAAIVGPAVTHTINSILRLIVLSFWRLGMQTLLFLAGLQGVSSALYESALVDGATEWEIFWKITLPMLSPTILIVIVYTIVDSFTDITNSLLAYILDVMTNQMDYAYASAMSWIFFVFNLLVIIFVIFVMEKFFIKTKEISKKRRTA